MILEWYFVEIHDYQSICPLQDSHCCGLGNRDIKVKTLKSLWICELFFIVCDHTHFAHCPSALWNWEAASWSWQCWKMMFCRKAKDDFDVLNMIHHRTEQAVNEYGRWVSTFGVSSQEHTKHLSATAFERSCSAQILFCLTFCCLTWNISQTAATSEAQRPRSTTVLSKTSSIMHKWNH